MYLSRVEFSNLTHTLANMLLLLLLGSNYYYTSCKGPHSLINTEHFLFLIIAHIKYVKSSLDDQPCLCSSSSLPPHLNP